MRFKNVAGDEFFFFLQNFNFLRVGVLWFLNFSISRKYFWRFDNACPSGCQYWNFVFGTRVAIVLNGFIVIIVNFFWNFISLFVTKFWLLFYLIFVIHIILFTSFYNFLFYFVGVVLVHFIYLYQLCFSISASISL